MRTNRWIWAIWGLVGLSYLVPYTLLRHVQAWYGSFLFWAAVGVLVIAVNVRMTRHFLDDDREQGHE